MTTEEELLHLQEEKRVLREVLTQQDEQIKQMQEQIIHLSEHMKALQDRLAKDSHHSHLPPSSDRFVRKPKRLRKQSEKRAGAQPGHPGATLQWSSTPDEVTLQQVERCEAC